MERMTIDDYLRTPETVMPKELAYGLVREAAAAPTPGHQWMVGEIFAALRAHLEAHRTARVWMAPIDVVLDRDRHLVLQPDIVVVANERLHLVTDRVWGAPDLVVEVLSPFPRMGRLEERLEWFAHYGVRECWLIHQLEREIEVLDLSNGTVPDRQRLSPRARIASRVLPELDASVESMLVDELRS
jgi:Uma2 family endonuclease